MHKHMIIMFFFLFGFKIPIFYGIYIHDAFMLLALLVFYFLNASKPLGVNLKLISISLLVFSPLVAISFFDTISGYEIKGERFYLIFKGLWLVIFILFINTWPKFSIFSAFQLRIMSLFVSIPVFLSVFMYFIPSFDSQLTSFYGIERFPVVTRFGGVFGVDVNALGMYATLTLILACFLLSRKMFITGLLVFLVSILAIMLSGMRTGILAMFATLLIFSIHKNTRLISGMHLLMSLIPITLSLMLLLYFSNADFLDMVTSRFSFGRLGQDLSGSDDGNLGHAINYLNDTLGDISINGYHFLFGVDSQLVYIDNLYVFLFLKYGVYPLILLFLISVLSLFKFKNKYTRCFIVFSLVISFKGVFIIGNYYAVLVAIIVFAFSSNLEKERKCL